MEWGGSLAAGMVCFLPSRETKPYEGKSVPPFGELIPFKVLSITETIKNVVLTGPYAVADDSQPKVWVKKEGGGGEGVDEGGREGGGEGGARPFWKKKLATSLSSSAGVTDVRYANDARKTPRELAEDDGRLIAEDGRPMWK